jgi:hypothetical protein
MRFDRDVHGEWIVDLNELAAKLGIMLRLLQDERNLDLVRTRIAA